MAITSSGQINGTSVKGTLSYELSSRTGTSFTIKFNHTIAMNSASASTDAGYETYTAYITVSGTNVTTNTVSMTVKPASVGLSGSGDSYSTSDSFTFYTTSGAATTANIKFYVHTNKNAYGSVVDTSTSSSGSLSVTAAYTAVTAPTSITVTNIVKPGGKATITWSGAKGGTSNSISGYDIIYYIDGVEKGSKSITSTSTSGSTTFTIPNNAARGKTITAKVCTKGNAGSDWYSSYKNSTSNGKVNSLPTLESVKTTKTKVKSGGDAVTFTVSAKDDDASQTIELRYSTDKNGTKTKFTSPWTKQITEEITYYFWAYDGLEYSSEPISSTIEVNDEPSIESSSIIYSNEKFYSSSENSIEESSYYLDVRCNFTLSKSDCYYYVYALTDNENAYDLTGKLQASDKSVDETYSLAMRELVGQTITGIKIKVIDPKFPTDYIESTYVPVVDSEEIETNFIPEITFVDSFNQINNINITDGKGSCGNYFYKNLRFRFNYNDGLGDISKINFYKDLNNDNSTYASTPISFNYTSTKVQDGNYHIYDFEKDFSSLEPNSNYRIKLVIEYLGLNYEINTKENKIYVYNFLNESIPNGTDINIYEGSSPQISCTEPAMGFASDSNSNLILHLGDYTTTTSAISNESDILYFTINNNELFRTLGAKVSNLSIEGYVSGKDIFGRELETEKRKFNINYLNNPKFNSSEFKISDGTNELSIDHFNNSANGFIIEGAKIIFNSEITSYLGNVKLELYRKSDNIDNLVHSEIIEISKPSIGENETKINIPLISHTFEYTRDEIKETKEVTYYIKMTNVENPELSATSSEILVDEVYQLNPTLSNYLASWVPVSDTEGNYNISFNLNRNFDGDRIDNGNFDTELNIIQTYFQNSSATTDTFKLNFEDTEEGKEKDKELLKSSIYGTNITIKNVEDSEGNTPKIFNSWNIAYSELELKITYTVSFTHSDTTLTFSLTKTGKTDRVLIYNILPTLSHRQNHLGINTPNVSNLSDAVLAISAYNNRTKIYLMGYENDNEKTSIIDLSKGSFEGFEIDCGGFEDWMEL